MIRVIKSIWKYLEPIWLGTNKKVSIRRILALVFSIDLVGNVHHVITRWEAGKSYADVAMLLGIEAALVAALLSLTTYSSYTNMMRMGPPDYYSQTSVYTNPSNNNPAQNQEPAEHLE